MQGPEVKHLRAVVVLAEERHFSRAAARLRIGQSGLTKQVVAVEEFLGFPLFIREPRRVTLTPAGEIFVAEARIALQHLDRAIHQSRSAVQGTVQTLLVGKSPYTDPYLITKLLSLRLPLFPELKIQLTSKLTSELEQDLLAGSLDLAFLTGVPRTPQLTGSLVGDQPFYIAMLQEDDLAMTKEVLCQSLANRSCILFERHVQPTLYDDFVRIVRPASALGCSLQHVMTAEDALQFVLRGFGVAVLTQAGAWRILRHGITIRPLKADRPLRVITEFVARSDDDSKLVSDTVRSLVRSLTPSRPNDQFRLNLAG